MFKRAGLTVFAALAFTLPLIAGGDVLLHGRMTLVPPLILAGLALSGVGYLLFGVLRHRDRAVESETRADRLATLTGELELSISVLEATNKRLNASEERYKGLVDAQGDAIVRRTPAGRVTYANQSFFRFFGITPEEALGTLFRPTSHPESPPPVTGRFAGRELGKERVSYDQHVKTVAGYRWIAWEDYAIRDSEGRLVEIQSVGRDITERKRLEAELVEARDRAEDANHAKSQFLATISHEIRTPMNGVLGMARLLLETNIAPDQKAYLEAISQSGLSLLSLIDELLDFAKIESGAVVIEASDVPLRPLIEGVSELLSTRAHAKGIDIVTSIASSVPPTIRVDATRLRQVLTNLVGNAVKFTEEGGVHISATVEPKAGGMMLMLSVRDTGIGVAKDKHAKIFEEFVQADSSYARRFEGTGLGLAISKRLIEAMGGEIGITDAPGRGSVFWVHLPLPGQIAASGKGTLAGKRFAVVSASKILRSGLRLQLQACGADMYESDELDAVKLHAAACDLLIFDMTTGDKSVLPDVHTLGIPTVVLALPEYRSMLPTLREKGIRGYLTKPVRQASLETRLAAVLRGDGALEPTLLQISAERRTGRPALSVLLAEDNPVNALLARELLRRRGHTVHEVTTGEAAVDACARNRFDLVVMDLHMPGLDGIEATRRIRSAERASSGGRLPIYALTADTLESGRRACLEAGMDGFLTKPVDPVEIDAILAEVGGAAAPGAAA